MWDDGNDNTFGFICEWDFILSSSESEVGEGSTYNGHTYQVFAEKLTPTDAEKYCAEMGGHLVTLTTEEECNFVNKLAEKAEIDGYTVGATDKDEENIWVWMTGEEWDYTNWNSPIEPNNGLGRGENYCYADAAKSWKWVDYFGGYDNYSATVPFVCEWDYIRTSFGSEISEWASTEIEEAYDRELIPEILVGEDLTQPITRAEFAAVSVKAYELMANTKVIPAVNNPFTDTKDVEVLKAYNTGITTGVSATNFEPNALLNREQAATMLTRVFKKVTMKGWTIETDSQFKLDYKKLAAFADDNKISEWAKDSVYFMAANEIINGVGDNKFAPQNTTTQEEATGYANATREQALIIATRMVDNLK